MRNLLLAVVEVERKMFSRADAAVEIPVVLLVEATVDELDDMNRLVEQLTDATRSQRRIEQLDVMRADLCTAIDGFRAEGAGR
jgi:hypothetical protein